MQTEELRELSERLIEYKQCIRDRDLAQGRLLEEQEAEAREDELDARERALIAREMNVLEEERDLAREQRDFYRTQFELATKSGVSFGCVMKKIFTLGLARCD